MGGLASDGLDWVADRAHAVSNQGSQTSALLPKPPHEQKLPPLCCSIVQLYGERRSVMSSLHNLLPVFDGATMYRAQQALQVGA